MESDIRDRQPENEAELFEILNTAWQNLSMDVLSALVASMPARCQAVLDAHGYATKYWRTCVCYIRVPIVLLED